LGLDIIYVQAKRWVATVGRPEIQKFAGALHGQHATKGIFITTSDFSRDANDLHLKDRKQDRAHRWIKVEGTHDRIRSGGGDGRDLPVKRIDNDFFEAISVLAALFSDQTRLRPELRTSLRHCGTNLPSIARRGIHIYQIAPSLPGAINNYSPPSDCA
jgi:hypothetical protein